MFTYSPPFATGMHSRSARVLRTLACFAVCALVSLHAAAVERRALLIGVGEYQAFKGKRDGNLEGPSYDVAAIREVLTAHWGFADTAITTLVNEQATRANILHALDQLAAKARKSDQVFIYFSGHGTSGLDSDASLPLALSTGAFVPHDWPGPAAAMEAQVASLIVGVRDLRPRLSRLDATGAATLVIGDTCYSGQLVRSVGARGDKLPQRFIPAANAALAGDIRKAAGKVASVNEPYPYRNIIYLSSAAEGERAQDIPTRFLSTYPTVDMKPHGAMTDALLRVLGGKVGADFNRDGVLSARELARAVADFMSSRAYAHSPQLLPGLADDTGGVTHRAVFGDTAGVAKGFIKSATPALPDVRVHLYAADAPLTGRVKQTPGAILVESETAEADLVIGVERGRLKLRSPAGDVIADYPSKAVDDVIGALRQAVGAKQLRAIAEAGRHSILPFEVHPSQFGGNFMVGQRLSFVVRPERATKLLILTVDATGKWSTLYPLTALEQQALVATQARFIPDIPSRQWVDVTLPLGMDLIFAFGFDEDIPMLDEMTRLEGALAESPRLVRFLAALRMQAGKYSFNRAEFRTLPALAKAGIP